MTALPTEFAQRCKDDPFTPNDLLAALDLDAPTSVRLHPHRAAVFAGAKPIPWSTQGLYLPQRPSFTYDPFFHAGAYYPQEAGSMYLEQVFKTLQLPSNPVVLDLSAAPGGKSTLLASLLDHKGILLANEINRSRAYILNENLTKWGYANTFVCNHKPRELHVLDGQIDLLVVDAPCSGEGMFRKDHNARSEWSIKNATTCALRQTDILREVWPLLKEGGHLIYSTCTFNPNENEVQLKDFIEQEQAIGIDLPYFEGLQEDRLHLGYYFFPNQVKSEGFYIAAIKKIAPQPNGFKKLDKSEPKLGIPEELKSQLKTNIELQIWQADEQLYATTPMAYEFYKGMRGLSFLKTGLHVAQRGKKAWSPAYDMVYSLPLHWELPVKELDYATALEFLNGQSQHWVAEAGFYYMKYNHQPIGMIKQIGTRYNNLHPTEWRIRHLPK